MKAPYLTKTCPRCEQSFELPNIKVSPARTLLLQFAACPHCLYVPDNAPVHFNKSGRCRTCSVPFAVIDHHAKGYCKRDYMAMLRHKSKAV